MKAVKRTVFTLYIFTTAILSVCLFLYGFFPIKSSSNLFSTEDDFPSTLFDIKFHKELLYKKSVGKTILVIIDGIRVDFVAKMPYTSAVLKDSNATSCLLTARVSAPTVTLPRVKAIVTGTVSSFIDVVLNFDTKELKIDNIVHQATKSDKKVVFYGDDTWVKLFPHQFTRSDGTSSFYVNDYLEVDNNVTRHLTSELEKNDWDLMVLHYLGLDHIGHIEGPKSSLIRPKLHEMDEIIVRLHDYLRKQGDGLLVVCGDHGMKDSGSHGGVSLPEVLVPVIALGVPCPNYDKEEILQVDLAATLSALWAAPLPADSIGVAVPSLLSHLTVSQRLYVSLYNAQQLAANFLRNHGYTSHESYKLFDQAKEAHYQWLTNSSFTSHHQVEALYQAALLGMSRHLSSVMANYNMFALLSSLCLVLQIILILAFQLQGDSQSISSSLLFRTVGTSILTACVISKASSDYQVTTLPTAAVVCVSAVFVLHTVFIYCAIKSLTSVRKVELNWSSLHWLLLIGIVLFLVSLFSSSFVEEEHQLWYFFWVTLGLVSVYNLRRKRHSVPVAGWVAVLIIHRSLRTLNQTGDQWAHLPDLSDWLLRPDNKIILSAQFLLSIILLLWCCFKLSSVRTTRLICVCSVVCIYLHKASLQQVVAIPGLTTSGTTEARLCLLLISLQLLVTRSVDGLVIGWSLLVSLLLRPYNLILLPAMYLCSYIITRMHTSTSAYMSATLHHWLGAVFFFYQGNSNSLANIDVAAGYVGLDKYNVGVVGILLLSHTYAMPVLAYLLNIRYTRGSSQKTEQACLMVMFLQLLHVLTAFVSVTIHRYHLFVWTVFSPKLLYVAAQTFVVFVLVSLTNIFCLCCAQRTKNY